MSLNKDGTYTGYIYKIENLINGKCYIGQTKQAVKERWQQHKRVANSDELSCMIIHRAIKKYGIDNFSFDVIETIICDNERDLVITLNKKEIYYINHYNTKTPNGYNITKGGNYVSPYCYKSVDVYDLYGNYIDTFDSIRDGSDFLCNGRKQNISECCNGKRKTSNIYIWRYHGDSLNKYALPNNAEIHRILLANKKIKINRFDFSGKLIKQYSSFKEIALEMHTKNVCVVKDCCVGKIRQAYQSIWRYSDQPFDLYCTDPRMKLCDGSINVYSMDGVFIKTFNYASDIYDFLKIDKRKNIYHMYDCLKNQRSSFHGYKWYRSSDTSQPDKSKIIPKQQIA